MKGRCFLSIKESERKKSHGTTKESKQTWFWGSASRATFILSMWQISGQLTSTHSPQESLYFWRMISPSRSKRSLTLCKRWRSFPILIIFLPSLYWNNTYIKTIQTKGQFRPVLWNRLVRSIMQKYTKVMQILMQNEYRQWRQWFPIKIEHHLQRMAKK